MRGHAGASPQHQHLMDEVLLLRERLHRVTVALSITEEMVAAVYERLAETPSPHCTQQILEAKRARAAAAECRAFAIRLDELKPGGPGSSPS